MSNQIINEIDNRVGDIIDNRIQEIDNRIQEIDDLLNAAGKPLEYRVTYRFGNFNPVPDASLAADRERLARVKFFAELKGWLDEAGKGGFQIAPVKVQLTPVQGYIEKIELTNAEAISPCVITPGINPCEITKTDGEMKHKDQIEAVIRHLAERAGDRNLSVPVRRDATPAPLLVQHVTVEHNATSGVGRPRQSSTCKAETTVVVSGIPKSGADAFVYDRLTNEVRQFEDRFSLPHKCGQTLADALKALDAPPPDGGDHHAFILVRLYAPVVAQYRSLDLIKDSEQQMPVPLTERAPACPPQGVPEPKPATEFRVKLLGLRLVLDELPVAELVRLTGRQAGLADLVRQAQLELVGLPQSAWIVQVAQIHPLATQDALGLKVKKIRQALQELAKLDEQGKLDDRTKEALSELEKELEKKLGEPGGLYARLKKDLHKHACTPFPPEPRSASR